jgi:predicted ArsR family transcriptional regulator
MLLGNGLALLSSSLLRAWRELHPSLADESQLVAALASEIQRQISAPAPVTIGAHDISTFVARLNAFHYSARWEAGAVGPRLLLGQCPYAAIIKDHPVLCRMDAEAIGRSLNMEARQSAKIDPDAQSPTTCIFDLR